MSNPFLYTNSKNILKKQNSHAHFACPSKNQKSPSFHTNWNNHIWWCSGMVGAIQLIRVFFIQWKTKSYALWIFCRLKVMCENLKKERLVLSKNSIYGRKFDFEVDEIFREERKSVQNCKGLEILLLFWEEMEVFRFWKRDFWCEFWSK